ncbi:MAG: YeiH family putative sulfate export transporter [Succinivibrio sp.]|nr:YeiH family putative sulfate export transporter [Succinivibrio sp.]
MNFLKTNFLGLLVCLTIAVPSYFLGKLIPIIGGPVFAILIGMFVCLIWKDQGKASAGIKFTSKKILQYAVILLGFGLNLNVVLKTGAQSLPIIVTTIATSLIVSYLICRFMKLPTKMCTLIGVGSSICGGSAIAATAPVINANDEEVAQAISVVFFFNVLAALIFPSLGDYLGMTHDGEAFGIFAGTAVNDTSSVTAAASTWDSMFSLGHETLDKAVTVKLTRTLAIIPIVLSLSFIFARKHDLNMEQSSKKIKLFKLVPSFIIMFILASIITTVCVYFGMDVSYFRPFKELSIFFIVMAMAAIGLNCNLFKLIRTGAKPIFLGTCCWVGITVVCLLLQKHLGIW